MSKGKVLVVDDDLAICEVIEDILDDEGYKVEVANDGAAALEIAGRKSFDVVLMDIKMPGMDGVETMKLYKKVSPGTPVIMISGYAVEDLISESLREGAFAALSKPLDMKLLFDTIDNARGGGGLVLITDDDEQICFLMRKKLEKEGFRVEVAGNGEMAVDAARKKDFDVIILDMKMPVMNGYQAFLELKAIRPDASVILISGYPREMSEAAKQAVDEGACIYLQKPFDMDDLLTAIRNMKDR